MTTIGSFEVRTDQAAGLVAFTISGLLDQSQGEVFLGQANEAAQSLAGRPWVVLGDLSQAFPQPELNEGIEAIMRLQAQIGCTKVALVVSSAAAQMQAKRLSGQAATAQPAASGLPYRIFTSVGDAEEWLGLRAVR